MTTLGFIGLGNMGTPMARNLLKAGYTVHIHDLDTTRMTALETDGAVLHSTPASVASAANIVFLMVLTTDQTRDVLFGTDGMCNTLGPDHLIVCMSSIPAASIRELQQKLGSTPLLDAPVSGGKQNAETGELAIMVGGDEALFSRALPLLECMGSNVTRIGPLGTGQTAKAANQILVTLNRAAAGEALLFARQDGADPELVRQALLGGLADSATLRTYGKRISGEDNPIRFDSPILRKDIHNVVKTAENHGLNLPFSTLVRDCYAGSDAIHPPQ